MQVGQLTVNLRTGAGKGAAHRLRASGLVPGVCYGESTDGRIDPLNVTVNVKALRAALDPVRRARAIVKATAYYNDPEQLLEVSMDLGEPMAGLDVANMPAEERLAGRGW